MTVYVVRVSLVVVGMVLNCRGPYEVAHVVSTSVCGVDHGIPIATRLRERKCVSVVTKLYVEFSRGKCYITFHCPSETTYQALSSRVNTSLCRIQGILSYNFGSLII